jgi:hypothetical protein
LKSRYLPVTTIKWTEGLGFLTARRSWRDPVRIIGGEDGNDLGADLDAGRGTGRRVWLCGPAHHFPAPVPRRPK